MKLRLLLTLLLSALAIPAAASVTYDYVGNDFTSGHDGALPDPELGLRITASVQFDDDVGPNFTGDGTSHIFNVTISTNLILLSLGDDSKFSFFGFELINGEIARWALYGGDRDDQILLQTQNSNNGSSDFFRDSSSIPSTARENVVGTSGTWSRVASPVPVPASFLLLSSALGGLGMARRRLA